MRRPEEGAGLPAAEESKVEKAKRESRFLRGSLADALQDERPNFDHHDVQVLKFHGSYQQRDRDARKGKEATPALPLCQPVECTG